MGDRHCQSYIKGWVLALVLIGLGELASAEIYFRKGAPHAKISKDALLSGMLEYTREGRPVSSFLGVPFGKIPARFEEAQPAPAWDGVRNATKHGESCPQAFEMFGQTLQIGVEDCLYLNVHVPMNNTQKDGGYPVLVSVHGGAFSLGSGNMIGPKFLLEEDIILVTFNYRLGAFGFLSTGDSAIQGNYGLKDAVLALKWVQENIHKFGGDPGRVTINGMSAGGAAVHYLMLSPTTEGLFHGAIAQSGSALAAWSHNPNPRANAVKLATYLKCPTDAPEPSEISTEEIATCLKSVSAEELNEAQLKFVSRWPPKQAVQFDFVPVVEPKDSKSPFLTESPWTSATVSLRDKSIPYVTGTTEDEGTNLFSGVILNDPILLDELNSKWEGIILGAILLDRYVPLQEQKTVAKKIRQFYFGDKAVSLETRTNLTNMFSDALFVHSVRKAAIDMALKTNPVYLYQYAHRLEGGSNVFGFPMPEEEAKLVAHGSDLAVMSSMEGLAPGAKDVILPDSKDEEFSKQFIKQWASFVINEKPDNSLSMFKDGWKPICRKELEEKGSLRWYKLDSNSGYIDDGTLKERVEFWEKLYEEHVIPFLA